MRRTLSTTNAQKKYYSKCRTFIIRLNTEKDVDIIEWLEKQGNKTEYIKELILADMLEVGL